MFSSNCSFSSAPLSASGCKLGGFNSKGAERLASSDHLIHTGWPVWDIQLQSVQLIASPSPSLLPPPSQGAAFKVSASASPRPIGAEASVLQHNYPPVKGNLPLTRLWADGAGPGSGRGDEGGGGDVEKEGRDRRLVLNVGGLISECEKMMSNVSKFVAE